MQLKVSKILHQKTEQQGKWGEKVGREEEKGKNKSNMKNKYTLQGLNLDYPIGL